MKGLDRCTVALWFHRLFKSISYEYSLKYGNKTLETLFNASAFLLASLLKSEIPST